WAREHSIEPPAYAEPAGKGWHVAKLRDREAAPAKKKAACPHCVQDAQMAQTPAEAKNLPSPTCCSQSTAKTATAKHVSEPKSTRWAPGIASLACRGLSTFWASSGAVLPPPRAVTWSFCFDACDRLRNFDPSASSRDCIPSDPPPRSSHA